LLNEDFREGIYSFLPSRKPQLIHRTTLGALVDILIRKGAHTIRYFGVGAYTNRGDIYFATPAVVFIFNFIVCDPVGQQDRTLPAAVNAASPPAVQAGLPGVVLHANHMPYLQIIAVLNRHYFLK
jgi:hypothetical protein